MADDRRVTIVGIQGHPYSGRESIIPMLHPYPGTVCIVPTCENVLSNPRAWQHYRGEPVVYIRDQFFPTEYSTASEERPELIQELIDFCSNVKSHIDSLLPHDHRDSDISAKNLSLVYFETRFGWHKEDMKIWNALTHNVWCVMSSPPRTITYRVTWTSPDYPRHLYHSFFSQYETYSFMESLHLSYLNGGAQAVLPQPVAGEKKKPCRCGSTSHARTNHHSCPLNPDKRWHV
jgi:hypothetical protein